LAYQLSEQTHAQCYDALQTGTDKQLVQFNKFTVVAMH